MPTTLGAAGGSAAVVHRPQAAGVLGVLEGVLAGVLAGVLVVDDEDASLVLSLFAAGAVALPELRLSFL
jgi:hypothetical protein